jgi:hypothetical protein
MARGRLGNWFWVLCDCKHHKISYKRAHSGFLLASLLVITLSEHSFYLLGLNNNTYVSGVDQRKKNLHKFCLSTKHWVHPDTRTCASFLWTQRMLNIPRLVHSENCVNEQVSYELSSNCIAQSSRLRTCVHRHRKGSKTLIIYIRIYEYIYK